jgi:S1-C subfamily serine protease
MTARALAIPLAAAVLGGAVTAGILLESGAVGRGRTTTIVQQAPLTSAAPASESRASGLTARDIYKQAAPGVVYVRARSMQATQSPFEVFPRQQENVSTGSGFVLDEEGHILTNAHVVASSTDVRVSFSDHRTVAARVIGKDSDTDLAVLAVSTKGPRLHPLELGDSTSVRVGDPTVAIGNPFGLERTLTTGVVSALQRRITAPSGFAIEDVIQTDAALNPGNSGGPLLDAAGRVIGINSQIETGGNGDANVGIGFAIPINTAKNALPQLQKGNIETGYLGVTGSSIKPSMNLAVKQGVLVESVDPGSGADKAGIKGGQSNSSDAVSAGGDIITKVDGKAINGIEQLRSAIGSTQPGDKVTLTVLAGGQTKDVQVTLGTAPTVLASDQNGGGGQDSPQIP